MRLRHAALVDSEAGVGSALAGADDAFIVGRAVDGDVRAFTVLLRRYSAVLRRYINRITRNPADTDEVLQEVFVIAWQQLPSLRNPDQVRAWLIKIASREALRHVTSARVHDEITDDIATVDGPDCRIEQLDLDQALRSALDALPQQQARVWLLREVGGFTYEEIATELGVSHATVRGALAQARKRILQSMGGDR